MASSKGQTTREKVEAGLARRRRNEFLFRTIGMLATTVGVLFLGIFGTTLGPDGDRYHKNHMHFDTADQRNGPYCH